MKKFMILFSIFISYSVFAIPNGFDINIAKEAASQKVKEAPLTERALSDILRYAYDLEVVTVRGKLTKQIDENTYEFVSDNNKVTVELNDTRSWSHINKNQLILITGEVDKDGNNIKIDVQQAVALSR